MWKLSCFIFLLITIGNCTTYDTADTVNTEISRNDGNHENRKHGSEAKNAKYVDDDRPYEDDYSTHDSEEFQGGKLIGKWRNNGAAFEPKWRDGDSVPLVPFNAAKQTNVGRHDIVEGSKYRDSSHAVTKPFTRDASVGRAPNEGSVEDTNPVSTDYPLPDYTKKNRYSFDKDYETRYRDEYDDSQSSVSDFPSRSEKMRSVTVLTDDLRYKTTADVESSVKPSENDEKIVSISSRSRYRDTFQIHPNEYELNDEEYQKPRPRKRRPPQNYEFSEMRAPTYSITWSTERYIESTPSPDRPKLTKDPEATRRRPQKHYSARRYRNRTPGMNVQRVSDNTELKSLLKMQQAEGLSLSELLQRRNLTLNDLLKGKAEVINVLKTRDSYEDDDTEFSIVKPKIFETKQEFGTIERQKWRPSEIRVESSVSGNEVFPVTKSENDFPANDTSKKKVEEVESLEHLDLSEMEDGQRKSNDNEKLSAIVRLTKPIILPRLNSFTEKSIVVTTNPVTKEFVEVYQNDESVNKSEKSTAFDEDEIMEFSDFTVKKNVKIKTTSASETTTTRNMDFRFEEAYEDSGSTLSIEHILGTTEQTVGVLPATTQEPNTFDNKVNSFMMESARVNDTDIFTLDSEYQSDEPQEIVGARSDEELAMGDQPYENPKNDNTDESFREEETWKNHQIFSTSNKPYEVAISEIEPEARAEIFELFSSGSSAKRLERLLKSRNMSIDELIALRQRGSSKVHMAEILRSKEILASRSQNQHVNSEAIQFENRGNVGSTAENLPATTTDDLSDIEIETTSTEIPGNAFTEEQTHIASIGTVAVFTTEKTNVYSVKEQRTESSTTERKNLERAELLEILTAFDSLPFSLRPDVDLEKSEETKISSETQDRRVPEDFVEKTKRPDLPTSLIEVGLVEEIAKEDSIPFDNLLETNVRTNYSSTLGEERKNLSKVRPSIIASGAILGVTIVVFLAIFIVCRIRQKQKYTYRNTFSRAVFQGPAMTARKLSNSSSLNTIMVNVVATSTTKRPERHEKQAIDDEFDFKSDIENDSLDANDSWETIPDFMK